MRSSIRCGVIILFISLLTSQLVEAQFTFTTNSAAIIITGYTGTNDDVCIPSTTNGLPVTCISNEFGILSPYATVTNITIPDSVTNIALGALESAIRAGVAFPESFLNTITVDTNNPVYSSVDGVLFDKAQDTLILYPCGKKESDYTVPGSVTNIAESAFPFCTNLASVTISDSVNSIGLDAFQNCFALTSATMGISVNTIGSSVFFNCNSLRGVYFEGNTPTNVASDAFAESSLFIHVYYLPDTTGWGPTFAGVSTVLWNPQAQNFGVQTNQFGFNITGSSNLVIVVEAATNLANPIWTPISTNTLNTFVGTNGLSYFSDPQWTNYPGRCYRFRSP